MKIEKVKTVLGIVVALIVIFGAVYGVIRIFATRIEVEMVSDRLDISIIDDQIFQQEQDIMRMLMEQRKGPMTDLEKNLLMIQERRLRELKARRVDKIRAYEQKG